MNVSNPEEGQLADLLESWAVNSIEVAYLSTAQHQAAAKFALEKSRESGLNLIQANIDVNHAINKRSALSTSLSRTIVRRAISTFKSRTLSLD